jgi:hypothetical protein
MEEILDEIEAGRISSRTVETVGNMSFEELDKLSSMCVKRFNCIHISTGFSLNRPVSRLFIAAFNAKLLLEYSGYRILEKLLVNHRDPIPPSAVFDIFDLYAMYNGTIYTNFNKDTRALASLYRPESILDIVLKMNILTCSGWRLSWKRNDAGFTYVTIASVCLVSDSNSVLPSYELEYECDGKKVRSSFYNYYKTHSEPAKLLLQRCYPRAYRCMLEDAAIVAMDDENAKLAAILAHPYPLPHLFNRTSMEFRSRAQTLLTARAALGKHCSEFSTIYIN